MQLARLAGARPVAVVSDDERGKYVMDRGAVGYVNRSEFTHWGIPPRVDDTAGQKGWTAQARAFGKRIWDAVLIGLVAVGAMATRVALVTGLALQ